LLLKQVTLLLMASSDADVRQDMNVEDEYYSVIEKRDTEILMRDRKLAEQKVQLQQQSDQLQQQSDQIQQQSTLLRKFIKMSLNSGMTYDAIAKELGIDVEQVKAAML